MQTPECHGSSHHFSMPFCRSLYSGFVSFGTYIIRSPIQGHLRMRNLGDVSELAFRNRTPARRGLCQGALCDLTHVAATLA